MQKNAYTIGNSTLSVFQYKFTVKKAKAEGIEFTSEIDYNKFLALF